MDQTFSIIGLVLVVLGTLVFLTAALGLLKFTDPYTRISAVGTAGGVGIILVITGALLQMPTLMNVIKVALIIVLQLGAAAVGTMAVARSAYLTNVRMKPGHFDDLAVDTRDAADRDAADRDAAERTPRGD
ncbi:MAG: monovalent cation/H(+) antiporter subunit G [Micrococcus sp.]|nr:monovalent cation/H(+) antiporter subunit G [Micrococcus sp.]